MNESIQNISLGNLSLAFIPVAIVLILLYRWSDIGNESIYSLSRMLGQLLIIGYFLTFLFESSSAWMVVSVLAIMVFAASWIALRTTKIHRHAFYLKAIGSILLGGSFVLVIITQGVLHFDPWYSPRYLIPLAGMIFAASMNSVSLAAERFVSEIQSGNSYSVARSQALKISLIPITNSLFAVGLVSLPGMMTGQILSGVSPLIAVRYQIMVMCMVFASSGISAACFLMLVKTHRADLAKESDSSNDR
ncbi:MAG: ABC transporter permease [Nitrospinales bacterium]